MNAAILNVGFFLAGAFVMLLVLLVLGDRRDVSADLVTPAEPVALPEPLPVPVAAEVVEPEPPAAEPVTAPMKVIPPWPTRAADPEPIPLWRAQLELETAPLFGRLPDHVSVWRYDGDWKLDDPQRTQMMAVIDGVDADDLDVDLGAPQSLPGFEVSPADRRRLLLSEDLIAEVTASLPSRKAKAEVSA